MNNNNFNPTDRILTIEFDNKEAAKAFKAWLCGQGEQNYWTWMEYREQEQTDNITAIKFDYHTNPNKIIGICGRLDNED